MTQLVGVWIAAFLTLAIFSFLYRDNIFYKIAEHLYVGVSAAFWLLYLWHFTIKPLLFEPLLKNPSSPYLLIPLFLGVMMLFRVIPQYGWVSRWPMAFTVGLGAALGITGTLQGILFPQLRASVFDFTHVGFWRIIDNLIMFTGILTTVFYFFFSRTEGTISRRISRIGIIFIMVSFGAVFGFTVMARVSILIGRVGFLLFDWLKF